MRPVLQPVPPVRVDGVSKNVIPDLLGFRSEDMRPDIPDPGQKIRAGQPAHRTDQGDRYRIPGSQYLIFSHFIAGDSQTAFAVRKTHKILHDMRIHGSHVMTCNQEILHFFRLFGHGGIGIDGKMRNIERRLHIGMVGVDVCGKQDPEPVIFHRVSYEGVHLHPVGVGSQVHKGYDGIGRRFFGS